MNFRLTFCPIEEILQTTVCLCSTEFLHIPEFLYWDGSTVCSIRKSYFRRITLLQMLWQDNLLPAIDIVVKNISEHLRIRKKIFCNRICLQYDSLLSCICTDSSYAAIILKKE